MVIGNCLLLLFEFAMLCCFVFVFVVCLVPGVVLFWFRVFSSGCLVPGVWFRVSGSGCLVPGVVLF